MTNNNRSLITEPKNDKHDKTNEENIYISEVKNLQLGARNKTTKESNSKPYAFVIGDTA